MSCVSGDPVRRGRYHCHNWKRRSRGISYSASGSDTDTPNWLSQYGNVLSHMTEGPEIGEVSKSVDLVAGLCHQGPSFFPSCRAAFPLGMEHLRIEQGGCRQHNKTWKVPSKKETIFTCAALLGGKTFSQRHLKVSPHVSKSWVWAPAHRERNR